MADTGPFDFTPTATPEQTAQVLDAATRMRQAAARLRELTAAATPGPWRYNPGKHWRQPRSVDFEEFVGAGPPSDTVCVAATGPTDHPASMADARFIAAMNPVVAAALAVWLDDSASEAEQIGPNRFALALADVLLGQLFGSGTDPQPSS